MIKRNFMKQNNLVCSSGSSIIHAQAPKKFVNFKKSKAKWRQSHLSIIHSHGYHIIYNIHLLRIIYFKRVQGWVDSIKNYHISILLKIQCIYHT